MLLFCRNCGTEMGTVPVKTCTKCGTNPVKANTFCRYCGHSTAAEYTTCPTCGAAIKPLPNSAKTFFNNPKLAKIEKIVNLTIIIAGVLSYIWFAIPPRAVFVPLKSATNDLVMASTGYTALPLTSISSYPTLVPPEEWVGTADLLRPIRVFTINSTQQLTIYSNYLDTTGNILAGGGHSEDVTDKAVYQSSNDRIASVSSSGLVEGVSPGTAVITVTYTAAPGSANRTSSAEGKVPITVACQVVVKVVPVPVTVRMASTQ